MTIPNDTNSILHHFRHLQLTDAPRTVSQTQDGHEHIQSHAVSSLMISQLQYSSTIETRESLPFDSSITHPSLKLVRTHQPSSSASSSTLVSNQSLNLNLESLKMTFGQNTDTLQQPLSAFDTLDGPTYSHLSRKPNTLTRYNSEPLLRVSSLDTLEIASSTQSPAHGDPSHFPSHHGASASLRNEDVAIHSYSNVNTFGLGETNEFQVERRRRPTPLPPLRAFDDSCVTPKQTCKTKGWRQIPLKKRRDKAGISDRISFVGRGGGGFIPSPTSKKSCTTSASRTETCLKTVHGFKIRKSYERNPATWSKGKWIADTHDKSPLLRDKKSFSADMLHLYTLSEDISDISAERSQLESAQSSASLRRRLESASRQSRTRPRSSRQMTLPSMLKKMDESALASILESLKI